VRIWAAQGMSGVEDATSKWAQLRSARNESALIGQALTITVSCRLSFRRLSGLLRSTCDTVLIIRSVNKAAAAFSGNPRPPMLPQSMRTRWLNWASSCRKGWSGLVVVLVATVLTLSVFWRFRSCSEFSCPKGQNTLKGYGEKRALKLDSKASKG